MTLSRIETLDLRDPAVVRQADRDKIVEARGWWTDWDDIVWFPVGRSIRVNFLADTQAFHESLRAMTHAISAIGLSMFAATPGIGRYGRACQVQQARPWWRRWR
jgi:hypothetical protein